MAPSGKGRAAGIDPARWMAVFLSPVRIIDTIGA